MKKWVFIAARVLIAATALWLAFRKINWKELSQVEWGTSLFWLIPAIFFYNVSQFVSASRSLRFYKILQPEITFPFNLRLYYKGMFYNLFLPGGIGGDAYKVIVLKKNTNTGTYKQLATATLLDRVTGLVVLFLIITILTRIVSVQTLFGNFFLLLPIAMILGVPLFYLLVSYYFKPFNKVLPIAGLLSVLVQGFQLLAFYCVLFALQAANSSVPVKAFLFFVSSVISALPVSIGGIGTRELAIATGATYFHLSATKLVSASLLFFMLVVISSLAGWIISGGGRKK